MSGRVFVTADLHFGHAKIAALRGFPDAQSHDDAIVAAWNRAIGKRDVVYVLGDLFRLDRVQDLQGIKKLAPGNHDRRPIGEYGALFSKVQAYFDFDGALLSHIPVHPSQFLRWDLNVHGHSHAHQVRTVGAEGGDVDPRYVCVSLEQCPDLEPMDLKALIGRVRSSRA